MEPRNAAPQLSPLRCVFDTNTVVSTPMFRTGQVSWLRAAWSAGTVVPVTNTSAFDELKRVFAYPKFKLATADRNELLADYLPYAEFCHTTVVASSLTPPDADGQLFLDLAVSAEVSALVTGDRRFLELSRALGEWQELLILTPLQLRELMG